MPNSSNGHDYVDLGLSVMWATCNVGANATEEPGDLYAWGEITPKVEYSWENYTKLEKDITGNTKYDVAQANWGGSWRMPTKDEIVELINNCTALRTSFNGVNGILVTSKKNGKSIFFPNGHGDYWCSSFIDPWYAYSFGFYNSDIYWAWNNSCHGQHVRPVLEKIRNDDICDTFVKKIREYDHTPGYSSYFLFDITKDGIPELWVISGTCEADSHVFVFKYEHKELKCIYIDCASHSSFHYGKDYVLQAMMHMGYNNWDKITYSESKFYKKNVFNETLSSDSDAFYAEPKEPLIEIFPITDETPIKRMFE